MVKADDIEWKLGDGWGGYGDSIAAISAQAIIKFNRS